MTEWFFCGWYKKIGCQIYRLITVLTVLGIAIGLTSIICVPLGVGYGAAFLLWLYFGKTYKDYRRYWCTGSTQRNIIFSIAFIFWTIGLLLEYFTDNQFNICWLRFPLFGIEIICAICGIIVVWNISLIIDKHFDRLSSLLAYIGKKTIWILGVHAVDLATFNYWGSSIQISQINYYRAFFDLAAAIVISNIFKFLVEWRNSAQIQ